MRRRIGNDSRKGFLLRYGFAVVGTGVGVALSALLTPHEAPIYALLVGVVAIAIWYGGLGPGLTAVAVGWGLELLVLAEEGRCSGTRADTLGCHAGDSTQRDLGERRASSQERARDIRGIGGRGVVPRYGTSAGALRDSFGCRHAVRRRAGLVARTPSLIGARGAALGLIEGWDFVIVDPRVAGSTPSQASVFRSPRGRRSPRRPAKEERSSSTIAGRSSATSRTARR